jgi:hypothetical protein
VDTDAKLRLAIQHEFGGHRNIWLGQLAEIEGGSIAAFDIQSRLNLPPSVYVIHLRLSSIRTTPHSTYLGIGQFFTGLMTLQLAA